MQTNPARKASRASSVGARDGLSESCMAAASITLSSEMSQFASGRGERNQHNVRYVLCDSATSADQRSQVLYRFENSTNPFTVPRPNRLRASNSGPQAGSPARATSNVTSDSRRLNAEYSVG